MPKTSEQMKNRYALELCSENITRLYISKWVNQLFFIKLNNERVANISLK
jgi:hypothetical protein